MILYPIAENGKGRERNGGLWYLGEWAKGLHKKVSTITVLYILASPRDLTMKNKRYPMPSVIIIALPYVMIA